MDVHDENKEFPITSITRVDVVSAGFSQAVVEHLTDADMREIASTMEDIYCDTGFWEDLELCTNRLLTRKEDEAVVDHDEHATGDENGLA
jgi:hypothetical protein